MQRELDDFEGWNNSKEMKSSTEKCKIMSLGSNKNFHCRDSPSVDAKGEKCVDNSWDRLGKRYVHLHISQEEFLSGEDKYARYYYINIIISVACYGSFWFPCS